VKSVSLGPFRYACGVPRCQPGVPKARPRPLRGVQMERPDETGRGAEAPTRGREATRERILASAKALFTSEGYGAVVPRKIASHAGVNVALINRYFGSKARLLTEILREVGVFPRLIEDGAPEDLTERLAEHSVGRLHGEGTQLQLALDDSAGDPDL